MRCAVRCLRGAISVLSYAARREGVCRRNHGSHRGNSKNSGETGALEARQIGEILRSLGIHSKRDRQGFSIVLTERMRRQVHDLARDFEVAPLEEGGASCSLCAELRAAPDRTKAAIAESEEAKGE